MLTAINHRLLTWYSIATILFRCPTTLEECTDGSPTGCKQYFQLKNAVLPHVEPYYNDYAAPYVELAKPYYDNVDQKVLAPARAYAIKYGGPRVAQAQTFGQEQWAKNIQPELTKYQALAKIKYDQSLAPHVDRASAVVTPYYEIAKTNALQTYHELVLPSYEVAQPYVVHGYTTASTFATETAIPSVAWAWNKTYVFLDGAVWPHLRFIYTENVEPQLLKIGQRLGRYNGNNTGKPVETLSNTAGKVASSFTKPSSSVAASSTPASTTAATSSPEPSSSVAPVASEEPAVASESFVDKTSHPEHEQIPAPEASPDESDVRRIARETVAEDLKAWQEKYSKAADEGAVEIEERIEEISKRMVRRQAKAMGKSLVDQLQESINSELKTLRGEIRSIVGQVKSGSVSANAAQEQITAAVRRAGMEIKDKSTDVRTWRENYDAELQAAVTKAAETHFKILDSIRDLALQKIGMKWAWMDGVTYKDWAKYHLLKERFDEWQDDLKNLIVSHPGLEAAENEGHAIEDKAMQQAQVAVKELSTLKQVANWKIISGDDSDEFDPEVTRLAAEEVEQASADKVAESASASSEEVSPASSLESLVSEASSGVNVASESASSLVQEASSSVLPGSESQTSKVDSEAPTDLASSVILQEPFTIAGETTDTTETPESLDADLPVDEEPIASTATASIKSVFMGAAAQSVPSRQPIMDDDVFDSAGSIISSIQSDVPSSIASVASSAYSVAASRAAEQYSNALSLASAQISGTPKPAHEQMLASVTSGYSQALASASSRFDAAQKGIFGTPTPTGALSSVPTIPSVDWANVEAIASSRLREGQAWAAEQYESAKVAIGLATATPTDVQGTASSLASVAGESISSVTAAAGDNTNRLLQNAQYNYYAGLGIAQARYSEFLGAASSALSSMTATPTPTDIAGTASSVASVASESAASIASLAAENASSLASAASGGAASAASVVGDTVNSAASAGYENVASGYDSAASAFGSAGSSALEGWNSVLEQISVGVYGQATPTPWYESMYSAAGDYAASATSIAGDYAASATEAIGVGATTTSGAGDYAAAASEKAAEQYASVSSIVAELLHGKEPSFSESVYSRLSLAYSTATASAASVASAASETVASVASDATEAAKHAKDEL